VSDENFISRWSRRKIAAREGPEKAEDVTPVETPSDPVLQRDDKPAEPVPLPPIESLTPESDFTPFMQPNVDAGIKRQALKKLFEDPRFNVMDGLDVYIDDYTKTTPIPEAWLEKLEQLRHLGIFKPDEEAKPEPEKKVTQDQPVASLQSDTSSEEIPAPPVGQSGVAEG
jgi:hypothetical protein